MMDLIHVDAWCQNDLFEVCSFDTHNALYTSVRMTNKDVGEGLTVFHLKKGEDWTTFSGIARSVPEKDFAGSLIFLETYPPDLNLLSRKIVRLNFRGMTQTLTDFSQDKNPRSLRPEERCDMIRTSLRSVSANCSGQRGLQGTLSAT